MDDSSLIKLERGFDNDNCDATLRAPALSIHNLNNNSHSSSYKPIRNSDESKNSNKTHASTVQTNSSRKESLEDRIKGRFSDYYSSSGMNFNSFCDLLKNLNNDDFKYTNANKLSRALITLDLFAKDLLPNIKINPLKQNVIDDINNSYGLNRVNTDNIVRVWHDFWENTSHTVPSTKKGISDFVKKLAYANHFVETFAKPKGLGFKSLKDYWNS